MLTKVDLAEIKKIIKEVVREELETEIQNVKNDLQSEMKMNLIRTLSEIKDVKDRLKNLEIKINQIQKDLKFSVDFLDKVGLSFQSRMNKIEKHLGLESVSS